MIQAASQRALEAGMTLTIAEGDDGAARLAERGLVVAPADGLLTVEEPFPGTPFFEKLADYDFYGDEPVRVVSALERVEGMPKELMFIPALLLLAGIAFLQSRRTRTEEATA